jgi:hypothetical protein
MNNIDFAIVHHANQYIISNGYSNREGMDDVIGVKGAHLGLLAKMEESASLIVLKLSVFKKVPMVPVHGDFHCENIFVDKDNATVIDFDKFCRSAVKVEDVMEIPIAHSREHI